MYMDEKIKKFLSRLKTVKNKACDERVTVKTIYSRIDKGLYNAVNIDGKIFVIEEDEY